jgi:hypothetical protein
VRVEIVKKRENQKKYELVNDSELRIGRGPQRPALVLEDLNVKLCHCTIRQVGRDLELEVTPGAEVHVDDRIVTSKAPLRIGSRLQIRDFVLELQAGDGDLDLVVTVTDRKEPPPALTTGERAKLLAPVEHGAFSKRWLTWAAAILFLAGAFAISGHELHGSLSAQGAPSPPSVVPWPPLIASLWNPGKLSQAHSRIGDKCGVCHTQLFSAAPSAACKDCHTGTREHAAKATTERSEKDQVDSRPCYQCHTEHRGPAIANADRQRDCVQCHAGLESKVTDFTARDHPELPLTNSPFMPRPEWALGEGARLFPHSKHLREPHQLTCSSCHKIDEDGTTMKPISMKDHCGTCHYHKLDPSVPHGSEPYVISAIVGKAARDEVQAALDEIQATLDEKKKNLRQRQDRRRTGEHTLGGLPLSFLETAERDVGRIFRDRCDKCHLPERRLGKTALEWTVKRPPIEKGRRFELVRFRHDEHVILTGRSDDGCLKCHELVPARTGDDGRRLGPEVALPRLADCLECHAGESGGENKVASACADCHKFHAGPEKIQAAPSPGLVARILRHSEGILQRAGLSLPTN